MNVEEAIATVDAILGDSGLSDLQEQIFRRVWAREKYPDIAEALGYDANYVKDLGAKIWKQLSIALDEKVTKSNLQSVVRRHRVPLQSDAGGLGAGPPRPIASQMLDWGEQIDLSAFIGRHQTLEFLSDWIQEPQCQLIALMGLPGIGKTFLAAKLLQLHSDHFAQVIWRSFRYPLTVAQLVQDLLKSLQIGLTDSPEIPLEEQITLVLQALSQTRCLIVLDGTEHLTAPNANSKDNPVSQDDYHYFLKQLGSCRHQSLVLITCRQAPHFWPRLEAETRSVRSLLSPALNVAEVQMLVQQKGSFEGTDSDWQALTEQYSGNPLALQIVASNILDFFGGNLSDFLAEGQIVFAGLSAFLQQQWAPLTPGERWVLYYLAVRREAVLFQTLKADILDLSVQRRLTETLATLHQRSLIERHSHHQVTFSLQTAVLEYATFHLIETIGNELARAQPMLLHQLPLLSIQSQDFIQKTQQQLLLQPILERLRDTYGQEAQMAQHLNTLLQNLQQNSHAPSYAAGNIVNLLLQLQSTSLTQDLSHLPLWNVSFASTPLHNVNLSQCDLSQTAFANAFSGVISLAFSPAGTHFVSGHENGTVTLWNLQGQAVRHLSGNQSWVWDLAWSPEGQLVVSASEDHTVRVWPMTVEDPQSEASQTADFEPGAGHTLLTGHRDRVWRVVCPGDDRVISASSDQTLKVWDLNTGCCLQTLTGHDADITALVAVEPESLVLSGGADRTLRLWDWEEGEALESWSSEQGGIWAIAYAPSTQTIYSAGDRGVIEVWQRGHAQPLKTLGRSGSRIWSLTLSPCERYLVAGGENRHLVRWDLLHDRIDQTLTGYQGKIWSVDYDCSGEYVITASEDHRIQLWNMNQGQSLLNLSSYSNWACEVLYLPQSSLIASAYADGNLYLWNRETGALEQCLQGHQASIWAIASHPLGTHILSGSEDQTLRIWSVASGHCQSVLRGHERQVWSVAWSPDGNVIASGSGDRTLKLWDVATGQCQFTLAGHQSRVWAVAFSPDSQRVASGSGDRTIRLWDRDQGTCLATLEGHQSLVLSVSFHPHQPILASVGGDGTCKLWDLDTKTCLQTISTPTQMIWSVTWSPQGTDLAMAGDDGVIRIWNQDHQDWIQALSGHQSCIWAIAFNADGTQLSSSSQDGTTRIWDLNTRDCVYQLQPKRLYEGLNLMDATGLTAAQIQNLEALGAKS